MFWCPSQHIHMYLQTVPLSHTLSHFHPHIHTEARRCPLQCAASLCALLAAPCACSTRLINDTNTDLFPPLCLSSASHTGPFDTPYLAAGVWNHICYETVWLSFSLCISYYWWCRVLSGCPECLLFWPSCCLWGSEMTSRNPTGRLSVCLGERPAPPPVHGVLLWSLWWL